MADLFINDKKNILARIGRYEEEIRLELGCGNRKRHQDAVGIDMRDFACVDIQGDVYDVLQRIPDRRISAIYSYHFFEHVNDVALLVREIARILADDGLFFVVVPHFTNPYYYADCTHKTPFGLYSFSYFARDTLFSRKVPHYQDSTAFNLEKVSLIFKSPRPFYTRCALKKMFQLIFNCCNYAKEFYEENCCYLIPCYEIQFTLKKRHL